MYEIVYDVFRPTCNVPVPVLQGRSIITNTVTGVSANGHL